MGRQGPRRGDDRERRQPRLADPRRATRTTPTAATRASPAARRRRTRPRSRCRSSSSATRRTPTPAAGAADAARRHAPTEVSCGQVLTESTLVGNDLDNCPGEGLVVGASNIVVDLNGHTIDGPDYLLENASGPGGGLPGRHPHQRPHQRDRAQRHRPGVRLGRAAQLRHHPQRRRQRRHLPPRGRRRRVLRRRRRPQRQHDPQQHDRRQRARRAARRRLGEQPSSRTTEIHGNLGEQVLIHISDGHRIEGNTMHGIPSDPLLDSDGGVLLEGSSDNLLIDNTVHDTGDAGVMMHMGSHRNTRRGRDLLPQRRRRRDHQRLRPQQGDRRSRRTSSPTAASCSTARTTPRSRGSDLRFNPSGVEAADHQPPAGPGQRRVRQPADRHRDRQRASTSASSTTLVAARRRRAASAMEGATFDALGVPVGGALITGQHAPTRTARAASSSPTAATRIGGNDAHHNAGFGIDAGENPSSRRAVPAEDQRRRRRQHRERQRRCPSSARRRLPGAGAAPRSPRRT